MLFICDTGDGEPMLRFTPDIAGANTRFNNRLVAYHNLAKRHIYVGGSSLEEQYQRQGYGVRMYVALMVYADQHKCVVYSDKVLTEDSERMYFALERRGYKVRRVPHSKHGQYKVWPKRIDS